MIHLTLEHVAIPWELLATTMKIHFITRHKNLNILQMKRIMNAVFYLKTQISLTHKNNATPSYELKTTRKKYWMKMVM